LSECVSCSEIDALFTAWGA